MGTIIFWLLVIGAVVFVIALMTGSDAEDAGAAGLGAIMAGGGCLVQAFFTGLSILFALWVVSLVLSGC